MFRASASFLLIISVIALAVVTVYLIIRAVGLGGLPGYLLGFALLTLILMAMLTVFSKMNDPVTSATKHNHQMQR